MKIVHISDTHLGYSGQGIGRMVQDPVRPGVLMRQQEADIVRAFVAAIDRIVDRVRPDVVIHSGDLFDSARPAAHSLDFAMTQLKRIPAAGIPLVVVEGNHSYPRDRSQGHALRLLSHLPDVRVVCEEFESVRVGGLLIRCLPHKAAGLQGDLPPAEAPGAEARILVTHGVADGLDFFRTARPAPDLAVGGWSSDHDYVALGHYHMFAQVPGTERAFYSGATSMVTWRDFRPGHRFGFNVVSFGGEGARVERELLEPRPMHSYGLDEAAGLSKDEVLTHLAEQSSVTPPSDSYCRVVVDGLDPLVRRQMSIREVEEIFRDAAGLTVSLKVREQNWESVRAGIVTGGDPQNRLTQLVAQTDGDDAFKEAVLALGKELLDRAQATVGAEDLDGIRGGEVAS